MLVCFVGWGIAPGMTVFCHVVFTVQKVCIPSDLWPGWVVLGAGLHFTLVAYLRANQAWLLSFIIDIKLPLHK